MVFNIKRELEKRGHEVHVLTTDLYYSNKVSIEDDSNIHRFSTISRCLSKYNLIIPEIKFFLWIKESIKKFDCVHIHGYRNLYNTLLSHYLTTYEVPYILQAHGSLPRIGKEKVKWLYDVMFGYRLLRNASRVIALNNIEATQYRYMGIPKGKISIIPNGIDPSEFSKLPPKGWFKKKFNIPEWKKIILYLGRIHKIKGVDILIKAYAYLVNKVKVKDVVLVIVGPDDGHLKAVKELASSLNILKHVIFTGPLYGKYKLAAYVDSEVYVLPARYEIWGITILEAYACGKPVIATEVGGLKELVIHRETGYLIKPCDVNGLAQSLYKIINDDINIKFSHNVKKFVMQNFTIEKVVSRLEKIYTT